MEAGAVAASVPSVRAYARPRVLGMDRSGGLVSFGSGFKFKFSGFGSFKATPFPNHTKNHCIQGNRRNTTVRAFSSTSDSFESLSSIAPLQPESPIGQFLLQILTSHPHLLPAAVERQLQQLKIDRDAEKSKGESSTPPTDLVLYRRIAEVKENERNRALEEILYALVVQKFMDANVSLVPAISQSPDPSERVDQWPHVDDKLESLHSREAYAMIKNHLRLILGQRSADSKSVAPISKLRIGQVYAASVMYGYFLKRVDRRFQLEKSMKTLPWGSDEEETAIKQAIPDESRPFVKAGSSNIEISLHAQMDGKKRKGTKSGVKSSPLRAYVMSFDSEMLQRYATVRSKEAFSIIEKHTEALFGRPELVITPDGTVDSSKDELIRISFGGLRRLILEAVTFGSFLWDVEGYVDSRYHFVSTS